MKFGIIGNDQMVQSCILALKGMGGVEVSFLLYDLAKVNPMSPLDVFCEKHKISFRGVEKLNTDENYEYIKTCAPDYILSISNFFVIKEKILSIPNRGTINFHNSAPSKYHGLNIPSWVIINGEKSHGAMWHFVEKTIDTGDVIAFEEFPLGRNETAASLMVKCIKKGIELFPKVIDQLLNNNVTRIPQSTTSSYYGKNDFPDGNGVIDFHKCGREIDQLVRGLNFLPFTNTFLNAKVNINGRELIINSIDLIETEGKTYPGRISLITEEDFHVDCKDCVLNITGAMDDNQEEYEGYSIAKYFGVTQNTVLKNQ